MVFHGHLDVVPARAEQFRPAIEGDRLYGRGAYDMKGGARGDDGRRSRTCASSRRARGVRGGARTRSPRRRPTAARSILIRNGFSGDFAITGEPTDLHIGVQAKGVLAMRLEVAGTAAHGATPWLGRQRDPEGARRLPLDRVAAVRARELGPVRPALDQPRPHPRRRRPQQGARLVRDRRRHPLPARPGPDRDPRAGRPSCRTSTSWRSSTARPRSSTATTRSCSVLSECVSKLLDAETISVGRDGASDAICFIGAGVPGGRVRPAAAPATTARPSGCRCPRSRATARRSWSSCA